MSDPRKAVRHTPSQGRGTMVRKKPKNAKKTLGRILQYTLGYKVHLVLIILAITGSSLSTVAGTYFLKPILNDYIIPLIGHDDPDLSGFVSILLILGSVYLFGIICTYAYNRLMLNVSTGTLWRVRVDLFTHMQDLPIKYFDTHTHGDLMSRFTNDVGTLREMLGQGIPQLISSIISVVGVFVMMLILSPVLTLLVIVMFFILVFIVKTIGGNSVKHFTRQQK